MHAATRAQARHMARGARMLRAGGAQACGAHAMQRTSTRLHSGRRSAARRKRAHGVHGARAHDARARARRLGKARGRCARAATTDEGRAAHGAWSAGASGQDGPAAVKAQWRPVPRQTPLSYLTHGPPQDARRASTWMVHRPAALSWRMRSGLLSGLSAMHQMSTN